MNFLFFLFSLTIQSSNELIVGLNTITITNSAVRYQNLNPQTFLIFPKPIPVNIRMTVQNNGILDVTNEYMGIHIGVDSATVIFEPIDINKSTNVSFYYLQSVEESQNADEYYLSTHQNEVFVLGEKGDHGFSTVNHLSQNDKIVYWLLTGVSEEIAASSLNIHDSSQSTYYSFDDIQRNLIEAKADEEITVYSKELFFFSYHAKEVENDQIFKIISKMTHYHPRVIPSTRYKFLKGSKTKLLKEDHSFEPYTSFAASHKQLPFNKLKAEDSRYEFVFDRPVIYIMLGLIGIILALLIIVVYAAKDTAPMIYLIQKKPKTDEESLLQENDKSPELTSLKNDGVV